MQSCHALTNLLLLKQIPKMSTEAETLLEALEKDSISVSTCLSPATGSNGGGTAIPEVSQLSLAEVQRAKELLRISEKKDGIVFRPAGDANLYKHIFHHVFSANGSIRKGARDFLDKIKEAPADFKASELFAKLGKDGDYNMWMMSELDKNNLDALKAWQTTIRLLGKAIHVNNGTACLNGLLSIAERGFKSSEKNIREETFKSWEVLIDNFSINENIINSNKRIKLLTRPLVVRKLTQVPFSRTTKNYVRLTAHKLLSSRPPITPIGSPWPMPSS